jgi:hypothetical protein
MSSIFAALIAFFKMSGEDINAIKSSHLILTPLFYVAIPRFGGVVPRTPDTKKSPDIRFRKDSARAAAPADGSSLTANEFCQVNEELDYERHFDARHDSAANRQDATFARSGQ